MSGPEYLSHRPHFPAHSVDRSHVLAAARCAYLVAAPVRRANKNFRSHPLSWLSRILGTVCLIFMFIQTPMRRPSLRVATVKSEITFFELAATISRRFLPSVNSLLTVGQAFNIASDDQ